MEDAVASALKTTKLLFKDAKELPYYLELMNKALALAKEDIDDLDAIHAIGQGWVAEETLAIAVYCAFKYSHDFDKAMITSVNHEGDSDSTGAVTGNILGARVGLSVIPSKYKENLELYDTIVEIADDLYYDCQISEYGDCRDKVWESKYIFKNYTCSQV